MAKQPLETSRARKEREDRRRRDQQLLARSSAIGIQMVVSPVIGWFLGSYVDSLLGTEKVVAYCGALLGVIAAFRDLLSLAKLGSAPSAEGEQSSAPSMTEDLVPDHAVDSAGSSDVNGEEVGDE